MRSMIRGASLILLFLLLLGICLYGLNHLLILKDSEEHLVPFFNSASDYDVWFMGDSQIYEGFSPFVLYERYGITSYNLGNPDGYMSVTYWTLLNALHFAKPKVIVLGIKDVDQPRLLSPVTAYAHTALDAFPMSAVKAETILDLTQDARTDSSIAELRQELFFPLTLYHSRWSQLTDRDLHPNYNVTKGAEMVVHVSDPDERYTLPGRDECAPEEGPGFAYLRRFIDVCQQRGIAVLLTYTPHKPHPDSVRATHTIEHIAAEYDVSVVNFVDLESFVVDYYTDCSDPASHLNPSGMSKITDYIGAVLRDDYLMPDHREENTLLRAQWDSDLNTYIDYKLSLLDDAKTDLRSRLILLHDDDFSLMLTIRPGFQYGAAHLKDAVQNIVRAHILPWEEGDSHKLLPLERLNEADQEKAAYTLIVDRDDEMIYEFVGDCDADIDTAFGWAYCHVDETDVQMSVTWDGEETFYFTDEASQQADMRLLVIDRRTQQVALALAFSKE